LPVLGRLPLPFIIFIIIIIMIIIVIPDLNLAPYWGMEMQAFLRSPVDSGMWAA
jgi:hypothetical protein